MEQIESQQYVDLAYDIYDGTDEDMLVAVKPPIVIFHGLLDNKENWREIARNIADKLVRKVYVLDMRNHGESPKTVNMTVEANVGDLNKFLESIGEPVVLIGHSLGGIASMILTFNKPHLVEELVIIDISPISIPKDEENYGIFLGCTLRTIVSDTSGDYFKIKSSIENNIQKFIKISGFRKIILSNMMEEKGQFKWKANLEVLEKELCHNQTIRNSFPLRGNYQGKTLLIHGSSNYVLPSSYKQLKLYFPNIDIIRLTECSHWLHMEKPDELVEAIVQFILKKI